MDGAATGAVFAAHLNQVLGPTLQAGDVVVLDNCAIHKGKDLTEIGPRLLYLPLYSPDFNPIEQAFSKLKTWQRTAQARTHDLLEAAIKAAAGWITEQDAKNLFYHC